MLTAAKQNLYGDTHKQGGRFRMQYGGLTSACQPGARGAGECQPVSRSRSNMMEWCPQIKTGRCALAKGRRYRVELSAEGEATLRMWVGSRKGERRLCERAKVILLSAVGGSVARISHETGLSPQTASKWRERFLGRGLDGPARPAAGGPAPSIGAEAFLAVVALASSKPADGMTRWSTRALDRTQPELHTQAGSTRRVAATSTRRGTTCLLAAPTVHSGGVSGLARTETTTRPSCSSSNLSTGLIPESTCT